MSDEYEITIFFVVTLQRAPFERFTPLAARAFQHQLYENIILLMLY